MAKTTKERKSAWVAGELVRQDVIEFVGQVATSGVDFSCRCRNFDGFCVWVYAGKSEELLSELDADIFEAIGVWQKRNNEALGGQIATMKADGTYGIDRGDGLGEVPLTFE